MINNLWKTIHFFCMNHKDPVEFKDAYGETAFYACPKYYPISEQFPNGHLDGEIPCYNRISFFDAEGIVSELSRQIEEDLEDDCVTDYAGMKFNYKNIEVTVLHYGTHHTDIGILNKSHVH